MRILVVGAGALGGYFGGRLAATGRDITFLVRPRRAEELCNTGGLIIKDPAGNVAIAAPKLVLAQALSEPYDLILLSCKAFDLESCVNNIAPAVGPETMILPVLNGMRHMETLIRRFGRERILGGRSLIFATLDDEGRVIHQAPVHFLDFGELDGGTSPRVERVLATLAGAGFNARLRVDIVQDMWDKWVRIATVAGATSLMRAPIGDILNAGGRTFMEGLFRENLDIAERNGRGPDDAVVADTWKMLGEDTSSRQMASLAKDMLKGKRIEGDHIIGDLLARTPEPEKYPLLQTVYVNLKAYELRLYTG